MFQADAQYYKTYKKTFAITLQAVCDARLHFTDCFAGYAGLVSDLRILRNSDLWKEIQANERNYFPEDEFIIGDKAYPVLTWCIPPYIDHGQLTDVSREFYFSMLDIFFHIGQKQCNYCSVRYLITFVFSGSEKL